MWFRKGTKVYISDIPAYTGIGIYSLVDTKGQRYIGSSKNVHRRVVQHNTSFNNGTAYKKMMQAIENGEHFTCELLECMDYGCTVIDIQEKESYYIHLYDTLRNGYNTDCHIVGDLKNTIRYKEYLENKGEEVPSHILNLIDKYSTPIYKDTKLPRMFG